MKKRVISLLLAGLLACTAAGCGGNDTPAPAEESAAAEVKEEAPAEEEATEAPPAEEEAPAEEAPAEETPAEEAPAEVVFAADLPQSMGLANVVNARQLGGYKTEDGRTVKANILMRSSPLADLSDEEIEMLRNDYNLTHVIDFRSPSDAEEIPNIVIEGVSYHSVPVAKPRPAVTETTEEPEAEEEEETGPVYQNASIRTVMDRMDGDAKAHMQVSYVNLVRDEYYVGRYAEFFELLVECEGGVLWHCAHGKDRTGISTALLLSALGVDRETIFEDYLLSNDYFAEEREAEVEDARKETDDENLLEQVRLYNSVDRSYLESSFRTMEEDYGSVEAYLEEALGMTPEKIEILREKYTE